MRKNDLLCHLPIVLLLLVDVLLVRKLGIDLTRDSVFALLGNPGTK